jgi:hypothetical protein
MNNTISSTRSRLHTANKDSELEETPQNLSKMPINIIQTNEKHISELLGNFKGIQIKNIKIFLC